jgi:microcystin-dependent protein
MEGFVAEIRLFAGNFAPKAWALCEGQLLIIQNNMALYSLLGTTYGGNGVSTFALPDFRSRLPVGAGQAPGFSPYTLGETTGEESFTLGAQHLPLHTHAISGNIAMGASSQPGDSDTAVNSYPASFPDTDMYTNTTDGSFMGNMQHNLGTASVGTSAPVNNLQPVLGMNLVICLGGIYPQRP